MAQKMKICKKCNTAIPKNAKVCPNCGAKLPGKAKWIIVAVVALGIFGAAAGGQDEETAQTNSAVETQAAAETTPVETQEKEAKNSAETQMGETAEETWATETRAETLPAESEEEFKASCQEIDYKELLRHPEQYIGQRILVVAKIQQIVQGGWLDDKEYYRIQTDKDGYELYLDDEYFMYDMRVSDETKLLQDDIIRIYAEFSGTEEITRALTGTSEEIPALEAHYIDILQ